MERRAVATEKAPTPSGPYSQAVRVGPFVYISGSLGFEPDTGDLVEGGIGPETEKTFQNIRNILEASGAKMSDVVRVQVFLESLSDFEGMNEAYKEAFPFEIKPARTTFQAGAMPKGAKVEIDVVAIVQKEK